MQYVFIINCKIYNKKIKTKNKAIAKWQLPCKNIDF